MAKITLRNDIRNELRSTCTQKVNEMLFNFVGPDALNTADEDDLLAYIKSVAVKVVHPEVYRQQFFVLKQSDGESITSFISRLKAQAMLCAFVSNGSCHNPACKTSYSEDMIRSQLIAGIRSSAYQSKVLSEITILQTLEQLTTRLLALEASERASSQFRSPFDTINGSEVAPIQSTKTKDLPRSSYHKHPTQYKKPCSGCGKPQHGNGRTNCPAWGKYCNKCKKPNHFANVCRNAAVAATIQDETDHYNISTVATSPY